MDSDTSSEEQEAWQAGRQEEESDFHDTLGFKCAPDMLLSCMCVCPVFSFLVMAVYPELDP